VGATRDQGLPTSASEPVPTTRSTAAAPGDLDQIERSPITLRFRDPGLEHAFQLDAGMRFRRHAAATVGLGALTWAASAVLLPLTFPVEPTRIVLAIGLMEVLVLGLFASLTRARTWYQVQAVSSFVNLAGGIAIIAIGGYLLGEPRVVAAALLINIVFAFGLNRYGPLGVAITAPYVALFAILVLLGALPMHSFEVFLVVVGFMVASVGAFLLEITSRDGFLQRRVIAWQREALEREERKSEALLANVLPDHIVKRLRERPASVAERLPDVSVLFADLVGFTRVAGGITPDALIELLDDLFSRFDVLADQHHLEKIKTIGDAYMAVARGTEDGVHHTRRAVAMGLEMIAAVEAWARTSPVPLTLRVGIHSGPVVAGVLGRSRFSYDLWGDTVNIASRMESQGVPGAVQVSAAVAASLDPAVAREPAGVIEVRGVGPMETFLVRPDHGSTSVGPGVTTVERDHPIASGRPRQAPAPLVAIDVGT
jgi:class 3 adenylate cyclase